MLVLFQDTILLKTAVVYPWPSKEQFAKAFVETEIPNDDYKRAMKNLSRSQLYAGQYPPNNLLNPIAWAKFIEAWKRGDFKN